MSHDRDATALSSLQRDILDQLLSHDFIGRDQLKRCLGNPMAKQLDDNGTIALITSAPCSAKVVSNVPVEGEAIDIDGVRVHVLLHVFAGEPREIEIYKEDGSTISDVECLKRLNVFSIPPP